MSTFRTLHGSMHKAGYDQEEAYFFERERELIDKARRLARTSKAQMQIVRGDRELGSDSAPGENNLKKAA